MKLYYAYQSCALAAHIVACEAGIAIDPVKVDIDGQTKTTADGVDFHTINPKGWVPTIVLDDGETLTESAAILQYLADLKPEAKLAPAQGSFARVRLQETLNHLGTDIHRGFSPLFVRATPPATREERTASLRRHYAVLDKQLAGRKYLLGDDYSVADAYLFAMTRWAELIKLDLSEFTHVQSHLKSIAARPAVKAAMDAQGLATA